MSTPIEQPPVQEQQPPLPTAQPAGQPPAAQAAPLDEDAAFDAELEQQAIALPEGDKLVPLSAVTTVRAKLREVNDKLAQATEGSARAQTLEQQVAELTAQLQQLAPRAQAYDAAVAAQHAAPAQPQQPSPEETQQLESIARIFDFYKTDGTFDLDKAKAHRDLVRHEAQTISQQAVAPIANHAIAQASQAWLRSAKAFAAPNGEKPDPTVLDNIWSRLDPRLTATKEGAQQAWVAALGYTRAAATAAAAAQPGAQPGAPQGGQPPAAQEEIPPPLFTERAGGRDAQPVTLSEKEQKYLKDTGMSEKEYLESANRAPWLRR